MEFMTKLARPSFFALLVGLRLAAASGESITFPQVAETSVY